MRASQYLLATLKESPADAEVISHQLMLRAGMIRKISSGLYTWLPLGLRTLRKVEAIVREEMDRTGAQELLMPAVQPAELWEESGRWQQYGAELLRIKDRHQRDFCIGPTHEEVITALIRNEIKSYRELPANFYQIQTKFRDERRPRFGIMRAREFLMKDAYSFHLDDASLDDTYQAMYDAYTAIFTRLGLDFRAVSADSGSIGGSHSHEFHVLAGSGEDAIAFSTESDYAANTEMAEAVAPLETRPAPGEAMIETATPGQGTIEEVARFLGVAPNQTIKTLIVHGATGDDTEDTKEKQEKQETESPELIALVLRGDHSLNPIKAEKIPGISSPLTFASDEEILQATGSETGSLGPVNLGLRTLVDRSAACLGDFVCGANKTGYHLQHVNWERDCPAGEIHDLRTVEEGDASPDGQGQLVIKRGIEVGHIFKLGKKYSSAMNATVLNENGKAATVTMGCYGIGVSRVVAAAIEQNHDQRGIIWPAAIAPFQIALIPLNLKRSAEVQAVSEALYDELRAAGYDVLLDDRDERPGVKFSDCELVGIPHRLVISDRGLGKGEIEYKGRKDADSQQVAKENLADFLRQVVNG